MIEKVRNYIKSNHLLEQGDTVTVGFSGGADSVCLLLCLQELKEEYRLSLKAVHVHHGLRGGEADEDAAFSQEFCLRHGIPFVLRRAQVKALAEREGLSLEEAGRILRYQILREEAGNGKIAVAHHQNDQSETLLFHLFRGTGIRGLAGMAPENEGIIRPLLSVSRKEIEEYLGKLGQNYRTDSTNTDLRFSRNKIRGELLPYIERELNPKAGEHLAHLAEQAAEVENYLSKVAGNWFQLYGEWVEDGVRLPVGAMEHLDSVIGKRVLQLAAEKVSGTRKDMGYMHIISMWNLCQEKVGTHLDLPGGIRADREYDAVCICRNSERAETSGLPELILSVEPAKNLEKIPEKQYTKWFDYDKIKDTVVLRTRRQGDYLELKGVGRKTVKAYMIDQKIPSAERDRIPLLADGSHILWIVGYRISEAYKITPNTRKILKVSLGGQEDE